MQKNKRLLTAQEAAEFLDISLSYLYKLTHKNKIKFAKPRGGGRLRFKIKWLENYALGDVNPTAHQRRCQLEDEADNYMVERAIS